MSESNGAYRFGTFRLEPANKQLLTNGKPVWLAPKVFETLLLLVKNHGRLVEKEEFLKEVWQAKFVEEVALAHAISELRKALNSSRKADFIETVPKRGYRFIAPVESEALPPEHDGATVAVLPFENFGEIGGREYVGDGLAEEVIAVLGQVDPQNLRVIGRTTIMAYRGTTKTLAEIGRELGASFLVESSVRAEGPRLRITSKLIRARDQTLVWSESYDSEPRSMIEFQRELSLAIAQQVRLRLSPDRLKGLAQRQTQHAEAYDLYLRGRYFWNQLSARTTRHAMDFYSRATELDSNYALAWSGLADAYASSPISGDASPLEVIAQARSAAERAVTAAPDLAEAHASLGTVKFWLDWNWRDAETVLRKATSLDSSYSFAYRMLGITLSYMGRHDEARSAAHQARELDPLDFVHQALSAQVAFNACDYDEAVEFAQRSIVLNPEFWVGYIQLAQAHERLGNDALALEALQKAGQFSGGNSKILSYRGHILAKLGHIKEAREIIDTLEDVSRQRYVPPYAAALVYAGLQEEDQALERLEQAFVTHDVHLVFLAVDPKWDAFRAGHRFQAILQRCAFAGGSGGVNSDRALVRG